MKVQGRHYRTIWLDPDDESKVRIIQQCKLPFVFEIEDLSTVAAAASAIREMKVRGAGLIGATAGWGMYLAARHCHGDLARLRAAAAELVSTRPTAVNLRWAVERQLLALESAGSAMIDRARREAEAIADEDAEACRRIGQHGLPLLRSISERKPGLPVQILTHCNAGWLAFVDYGSATAPIYAAHDAGIPVHVWVDETRPRNQGARLTAWELAQHGVPHTVIPDNTGGHLMQHGLVDIVLTGTDRTTRSGDVANKIGTYLKALAAKDNAVPFYVALPSSSFDWDLRDGVAGIPIEQRDGDEVRWMEGITRDGAAAAVNVIAPGSPVANFGFDVTPSRLISGLITERGVCSANEDAILRLFPEQRPS